MNKITKDHTCICCGKRRVESKGVGRFSRLCWKCRRPGRHKTEYAREVERHGGKSNVCSKCGFVAKDSCQSDIDHIDGNHKNNSIDNLWILCANCHRLKTNRPDLFWLNDIRKFKEIL